MKFLWRKGNKAGNENGNESGRVTRIKTKIGVILVGERKKRGDEL